MAVSSRSGWNRSESEGGKKKKQQHEAEIGNQWRAVLQAPGAVTQDGATHRNTAASRRHEGKLMWPAERQWEQEEGVFEWVARRGVVRYIKELVKCSGFSESEEENP